MTKLYQWTTSFRKQLNKFDKATKEKIIKKIEKVVEQPDLGKPLRNVLKKCFEEHCGKYRILYLLNENNEPVFFYIHDKEDDNKNPSIFNALKEARERFFGVHFWLSLFTPKSIRL